MRASGYRSSSQVPGEGPNLSCENFVSSKVTRTPPERRYFPFSFGAFFRTTYKRRWSIRREYEFGVGTIRGVAHKLSVHRRMVRQALASAEPPERKQVARERPVVNSLRPLHRRHLRG